MSSLSATAVRKFALKVYRYSQASDRQQDPKDYRYTSESCREALNQLIVDCRGQSGCSNLKTIEKSWSICETFFFNPPAIIAWLRKEIDEKIRWPHNAAATAAAAWAKIYSLVVQGKLRSAYELVRKLDSVPRDESVIHRVEEVMALHPYVGILEGDGHEVRYDELGRTASFHDWRERVGRLKSSGSLSPALQKVFDILTADQGRLKEHTEDWTQYALALLLYAVPVPTTGNITRIITMSTAVFSDSHEYPRSDIDDQFLSNLEDLLKGIPGPFLTSIYLEARNSSRGIAKDGEQHRDDISTVALASVYHLTIILANGAQLADFYEQLTSPNDLTFPEEVALEFAEHLIQLDYPVEVVAHYIDKCQLGEQSQAAARTLLPRMLPSCDEDTLTLSQALRRFELPVEAREVEVARGSWWMQRRSRSGIAKALHFYQLSDLPGCLRSAAILDRALWAVAKTVTAAFKLSIQPLKPCLPIKLLEAGQPVGLGSAATSEPAGRAYARGPSRMEMKEVAQMDLSAYLISASVAAEVASGALLPGAILAAAAAGGGGVGVVGGVAAGGGGRTFGLSTGGGPGNAAAAKARGANMLLLKLLGDELADTTVTVTADVDVDVDVDLNVSRFLAEASSTAVDAVLMRLLEDALGFGESLIGALGSEAAERTRPAVCLNAYVRAVRAVSDAAMAADLLEAHAGHTDAVRILLELLQTEVLPMRHWMHVIELIVAIDARAGQLRDELLASSRADGTAEGLSCLSKPQAFLLSLCLARLEAVHTRDELLAGVDADDYDKLRLSVLGVVAASVIQDNADSARKRQEERSASRSAGVDGAAGIVRRERTYGYHSLTA